MRYELYFYNQVGGDDFYNYEMESDDLGEIEAYIAMYPDLAWVYIDNTGETYAKFGFSTSELKDIILPFKTGRRLKKIHIKNGDIRRFIKDYEEACKAAEDECDELCRLVDEQKAKKIQTEGV